MKILYTSLLFLMNCVLSVAQPEVYLILPNWILTNGFRQPKPQAANSPYSQPRMKPASDCGKVT